MDKEQKRLKTNKILWGILSILMVFLLYLGFRFSVGGSVIVAMDDVFSAKTSGSIGENLTTISLPGVTGFDQKSTLLSSYDDIYFGGTNIKTTNPKILAMRKFLIDYNSPMYPYAEVFVNEAEKYKLDWRLVASISGVESAFGTLIPYRSNNGWGWRGGGGGEYSVFPNWGEGIKTVTKRLAVGYGTDLTPFQIEPTYCPPCYANPSHAWANGVIKFMNELDYYLKNLEKL